MTKKTPPHYHAVRLRADALNSLTLGIADYRHREGIHLTKNQAVIKLITECQRYDYVQVNRLNCTEDGHLIGNN